MAASMEAVIEIRDLVKDYSLGDVPVHVLRTSRSRLPAGISWRSWGRPGPVNPR
jgi:hypothetical protein